MSDLIDDPFDKIWCDKDGIAGEGSPERLERLANEIAKRFQKSLESQLFSTATTNAAAEQKPLTLEVFEEAFRKTEALRIPPDKDPVMFKFPPRYWRERVAKFAEMFPAQDRSLVSLLEIPGFTYAGGIPVDIDPAVPHQECWLLMRDGSKIVVDISDITP